MDSRMQALTVLAAVYRDCSPIYSGRIQDAILYGSYARGDYQAESDVDILLIADMQDGQIAEKQRELSAVSSRLSLDYDVTISIQTVPLTQFTRYADYLPFYQNILREGIHYAS